MSRNNNAKCDICGNAHETSGHRKAEWYQDNKERIRIKAHLRYLAHAEESKAASKLWKAEHPEAVRLSEAKYRANNVEKEKKRHRKYKQEHPEKHQVHEHNRRARKRGAQGHHTIDDIERQYNAQKGLCWWCLKDLNRQYEIDHLVPLAKGGHNAPSNLVLAHAKCNRSKGSKLPSEYCGRLL